MSILSEVNGRGLAAAKPASPKTGYLYYSTDVGSEALERWSGSAWEAYAPSGGGGGSGASFPDPNDLQLLTTTYITKAQHIQSAVNSQGVLTEGLLAYTDTGSVVYPSDGFTNLERISNQWQDAQTVGAFGTGRQTTTCIPLYGVVFGMDFCTRIDGATNYYDKRDWVFAYLGYDQLDGAKTTGIAAATYAGNSTAAWTTGYVALSQAESAAFAVFRTADGTTIESTTTTVDMHDGQWHDVLIISSYAGDEWKCYIDGVLEATHSTNIPVQAQAIFAVNRWMCSYTGASTMTLAGASNATAMCYRSYTVVACPNAQKSPIT